MKNKCRNNVQLEITLAEAPSSLLSVFSKVMLGTVRKYTSKAHNDIHTVDVAFSKIVSYA